MGEKQDFFYKWCWQNWTSKSYMQKNQTELLFHTYIKINSKCIKDLNVRPEAIKLWEENIDSTFFHTGLSNIFLDMSPQTREIKQK